MTNDTNHQSPVSVPEGDAREIAREIADLACGPFPTGGPAAKHREKIADRITAALLSAERRARDTATRALADAIECVEAWSAYAGEYFQEKHDLAGDLARLRAALSKTEPKPSDNTKSCEPASDGETR